MDKKVEITLIPDNRKITAMVGEKLINVLIRAKVPMEFPCGGRGTCGKCKVKIKNPRHPKIEELRLLSKEELEKGVRLACLYTVEEDMEIEPLVRYSTGVILEKSYIEKLTIDPPIKKVPFRFPSKTNTTITMEEQLTKIVRYPIDSKYRLEILRLIAEYGFEKSKEPDGNEGFTAIIRDDKINGVEKGDTTELLYGVAVDIGTTTVVVSLVNMKTGREDLTACSSPAGPALEGVNISCGMRAEEGAIAEVRIDREIKIRTIGNTKPFGFCGSGIIDLVSELIKVGIINASGKIDTVAMKHLPKSVAANIIEQDGKPLFIVTQPDENTSVVYLTSRDIRQVQLAKGAIWAGITALLEQKGLKPRDLERVYVAGAFGAHLRPESLIGIGMAAAEWKDRIKVVGNTSKAGAMMCLLSRTAREEIQQLSDKVKYIELSMQPDFDRIFTQSLKFPKGAMYHERQTEGN